jgi:hypothetical protein
MKKYTHAWLCLKAIDVLENHISKVNTERQKRIERLLNFIRMFPDTFIRGAWFPDTVIKDNIEGGHTWKYQFDAVKGIQVKYKPPDHNYCLNFVKNQMDEKVSLITSISDLPDRCEALSQTIRDMIKITNMLKKGDILAFNDTQISIMFLMLGHYVADSHVPMHCDVRDFSKPSKIHEDIESFWENEIENSCKINKTLEKFDLDENLKLQQKAGIADFENTIVGKCNELLKNKMWTNAGIADKSVIKDGKTTYSADWAALLGITNKNVWDYMVGVCHVSFLVCRKMIPDPSPAGIDYNNVRIISNNDLFNSLKTFSPMILADAINSIALIWLVTWERWEVLK